MWYLIGAVLVGAMIIAGVFVVRDDNLNSVGDVFAAVTGGNQIEENILTQDMIKGGRESGWADADIDFQNYARNNMVVIDQNPESFSGLQIQVPHDQLEPESTYAFTYSYQKLSGTLESFGGHMYQETRNNTVYVNQNQRDGNYHDMDSVYTGDHTDKVDVHVVIETPPADQYSSSRDHAEIWIQPNRGVYGPTAEVAIYDLALTRTNP